MLEISSAVRAAILSLVRIVIGLLFMEHGTSKYLGFPAGGHLGDPHTMSGAGGILELVGGALIVLGLFTRPVAFVLCGEMAVAYFYAHFPRNFFPVLNGGDAAVLYCFMFLLLAFLGGGSWSIDALWSNSSTQKKDRREHGAGDDHHGSHDPLGDFTR